MYDFTKYRYDGKYIKVIRFIIHDDEPYGNYYAINETEKEQFIELCRSKNPIVTEVDTSDYEWLDGMEFTREQLKAGELDKAIELGEEAYMALKNAPTQDEINAMLMLQIAELKAGGVNE